VPVGGPILTRPYRVLIALFALGAILIAWRFLVGLGPSTAMNDGYPFGLWIAFDVVTGTALACGGYAVAIVLYILNKGKYHPLIRPAILTSALGYSIGAISVIIDVGRPWIIWKVPTHTWAWNLNSALLEVALCIMAYVVVLWIELSPAFFEKWMESKRERLARFAKVSHDFLEKALLWIVALGLLLPTMHQSSLGSMMLLAGDKLHGLWSTGLLPLLFLVGCLTMGYGVVVMESALSSFAFKRKPETRMLRSLYGAAVICIWLFLGIRFVDLAIKGHLGLTLQADLYSTMFWLETVLLLIPALAYHLSPAKRGNLGNLFRWAFMLVAAGALYRFDTYLVAFNPGDNWAYFPAVPEQLVTIGLVALEIMAYIAIVKRFPILAGETGTPARRGPPDDARPGEPEIVITEIRDRPIAPPTVPVH
jgi:Ni/Fe-hydrogenase subunit HybB-like protein